MTTGWTAVLLTSLSTLVGSCGGTTLNIAVKPDRWICPGTPITLMWQASRTPTITAVPPIDGLADLPQFGAHQMSIAQTTHFLIEGGHWWWASRNEADALVYDPSMATFPASGASKLQFGKVGSEVECTGDTAWAAFDQGADHWDPRLTVGDVKGVGTAKVSVWHAGIHAQVDTTPNPAFKGTPAYGMWLFETSCHPRPRVVAIELTATCTSSKGPQP